MAGLHPQRARALVDDHGSAAAVVRAIAEGRVPVPARAGDAVARPIEEVMATLRRLEVEAVVRGEPAYPILLEEIPDPPEVLFVRGPIPGAPAVAVVGTRRCTAYGRAVARSYGAAIAAAGWVLVSGLARGIDAEAHRGTVGSGGAGIAVLGSGPNVVYPAENRELHDALLEAGGAVVTEYPPGTPPEAWRFPLRNRIIAGLAAATVVVEAGVTGGALITASAALEQGRPVLAVPGDIDRATSVGCNLLIRDGAIPVLGPEDLVEALSFVLGPPRSRTRPGGSGDEEVLAALGAVGCSVDDLVARLGIAPGPVLAALARLEAAGRIMMRGSSVLRAS